MENGRESYDAGDIERSLSRSVTQESIVRDRATFEPGEAEAQKIREFLRENGVLLSTTGPLNNVIKIRPPMVFSKPNAELLLEKLEQALESV